VRVSGAAKILRGVVKAGSVKIRPIGRITGMKKRQTVIEYLC
jgi:hypothetical protein